ncbi:MAG: hypothetical protein WBE05_01920 [Pseudolabrys sp.]
MTHAASKTEAKKRIEKHRKSRSAQFSPAAPGEWRGEPRASYGLGRAPE